jgi:sigma-B regulation protein RsbU (phosphoserine phosphatase)
MGILHATRRSQTLESFTDVVFLSDKPEVPAEIRRLFRQKKLSFRLLPLDQHHYIRQRPDLIGTAVIDAEGMNVSHNPQLGRVIESLERHNIGTILLTQRIKRPVRSFSLVPSESSFSLAGSIETISLDDLWAQISVNLAQRKNLHAGIAVKPPVLTTSSEKLWKSRMNDPSQPAGTLMDTLTEQLRLAGLVQRDFLPSHLPNGEQTQWATMFLPAEWVSGDIYDVARIDEQHIGFYLADAVGHSMPSALLTIFIKQALVMRETIDHSYRIFTPAEAMKNLNLRMVGQKLSGYQFATCCYCLLNVKTRQLTFARAGHPYPILLRAGQPPQQLQTRGALLGIFENAEFVQQTVQLESGDRLLLYSDGAESLIGRAEGAEGMQFTDELLAMQDAPITEILDRLTEMAGTRRIDPAELDDMTVVGLEMK